MAITARIEERVDKRKKLVADVSKLMRQFRADISNQLVGNKPSKERTALDRHKLGVFEEVVKSAGRVFNLFSLCLMPPDGKLRNSIIYVELISEGLKYTHLSAEDDEKYEGVITSMELPKLAEIADPLEISQLQSSYVNILKVMTERGDIKLKSYSRDIRQIDEVMRAILMARDTEFDLLALNLDKIYSAYYESHILESNSIDIDDKLKRLCKLVYQLYYRLLRQKFCLEQFSVVDGPESQIQDAINLPEEIAALEQSIKTSNVNELEDEIIQFINLFSNFQKHLNRDRSAQPFGEVLKDDKSALSGLLRAFKSEVEVWLPEPKKLQDIASKVSAAAKSGNESLLAEYHKEVDDQLELIINVRNSMAHNGELTIKIKSYLALLHGKIKKVQDDYITYNQIIDRKFKPIISLLPYLCKVAEFMNNEYDSENHSTNEFSKLYADAESLPAVFGRHDGLLSKEWYKLGENLMTLIVNVVKEMQDYSDIFLAKQSSVKHMRDSFDRITNLHASMATKCEDCSSKLAMVNEQWRVMPAQLDLHWKKPLTDLLYLKADGLKSLLRRHWWKMLIGAAILGPLIPLVGVYVLGLTLTALAIALTAAVSLILGAVIGLAVGFITDRFCKAKPNDHVSEKPLRRHSSSEALHEMGKKGALARFPNELMNELVIDIPTESDSAETSTSVPVAGSAAVSMKPSR